MKSEFLMLGIPYDPERHIINGWWASEKLDGHRALWLPSSRGIRDHLIGTEKGVATGLWSRYGKIIYAPDWWLDKLPPIPLDGELYNPLLSREAIASIVTRSTNVVDWSPVGYWVFDAPSESDVTYARSIYKLGSVGWGVPTTGAPYSSRYLRIPGNNEVITKVIQQAMPLATIEVDRYIEERLALIKSKDGEGLMVRDPWAPYSCSRVKNLLKIKPRDMSEATIVGFTAGKGRLAGMVGALIVSDHGKRFELSGMTDLERKTLAIGDRVRYAYRRFSADGIPLEASYKGKISP